MVVLAALVLLAIVSPSAFLSPSSEEAPVVRDEPTSSPETTPPPVEEQPEARIAIAGDTGMRNAAEEATGKRMQIESEREGGPYDALVILGDMIYPDGDADLTEASVNEPFANILDDAVLLPVLGNHDVQSGEGAEIMRRLGRDSGWYVERIGPVRFITLDSNRVRDPRQMAWLRRELAKEQEPGTWTVPVMHHPAYSAGHHGSTKSVQRRWLPLFEQADVRLTLAGHDHDYQRSIPLNGMTHVVSGGGAKLREAGRKDFTAVSESVFHYVDLLVYDDRLEGRAIDHDGNLVDEFTIKR